MLKTLLVATAAVTLMSGAGMAQSSYSRTTTEMTAPVAPRHDVDVTTTTKQTSGRNGVMIEKETTGDEVTSTGLPGAVHTESQTTTVR